MKEVAGIHLKNGSIVSCGCYRKEINAEVHAKHGHNRVGKRTREYKCWCGMIRRCYNPKEEFYYCYGGRGIKVCQKWLAFENFLADMGLCPENMSLDRINANGDYCKGNCRWATNDQQANNRRNNVVLELQGERMTLTQWSKKLGIQYGTLKQRRKLGWSVENILTKPVRGQ